MSSVSAEELIHIGRAQIDQANATRMNTVPQHNRPELAATGVANQVMGKIKRNRAAADEQTGIDAMTDSILAAAAGQPLETSVSSQRESQANAKMLLQFLLGQQQQEAQKNMESGGKASDAPRRGMSADSPKSGNGLSDTDIDQLLQLLLREQEVESKKAGAKGGK